MAPDDAGAVVFAVVYTVTICALTIYIWRLDND